MFFLGVFVIFAIIIAIKGVIIVKQAEVVIVERLGKFDRILESKGAVINAATSKDYTHFYITIPSKDLSTFSIS